MTLTEEQRVKSKGAAEIMVKRRLGIPRSLVDECGLRIAVTLVPSQENKSDALMRVRKRWLSGRQRSGNLKEEYCAPTPWATRPTAASWNASHWRRKIPLHGEEAGPERDEIGGKTSIERMPAMSDYKSGPCVS